MQPFQLTCCQIEFIKTYFVQDKNLSLGELDGRSGQNKSLLLYLPYNPVPCVYLRAHWPRSPRANGSPDLSPMTPPSAGQTLTLEQMDNGLYALSAPDHTLLLPALATALPFTSCCPPFLCLHLPCPVLDCRNSQKHLRSTFCVFFHFYNSLSSWTPPLLISCLSSHHLFYTWPFSFPLSIHPHPCRCSSFCRLFISTVTLLQAGCCAAV